MPEIKRIEQTATCLRKRKRVAAYARVSRESDRSFRSLSAQISYYSGLIQKNHDWEYAGVYADDGISGTGKSRRTEFRKLLDECEAGNVDIILTKSVSRFARNTVDLLETVRHLKSIGVEVRFEKENISTMSGDGELMLTILASFAQAEAEAASSNIKWSVQKKFQNGEPFGAHRFLGYIWDSENGRYAIVPEEAEIVRRIYEMFLDGASLQGIVDRLAEEDVRSYTNGRFYKKTISVILQNYTYTGNLMLQRVYSHDPLTKKKVINRGEIPRYLVENTHDAIIDMDTFTRTQEMLEKRRAEGSQHHHGYGPFTHRIFCGCCGMHYRRERASRGGKWISYVWKCSTKIRDGASACSGKNIAERELIRLSCEVLGWERFDEDRFKECVERIEVIGDDRLDFRLSDGTVIHKKWSSTLKTKEGRANAERYCDTGNDK